MGQRQPEPGRATVALLGTGRIGRPVAQRLLAAGFGVRAWNRNVAHAAPLVLDGAYVAPFPARAAEGADVLLTLLPDLTALMAATRGPQGALAALPFGALWIQMGDLGVQESARLRQLALCYRARYVDAPFMGSPADAREGRLTVLASGAGSARAGAAPVLDALAQRTLWLDRSGGGPWLKHALRTWAGSLPPGSVEQVAISAALGLDRALPSA
jgi:3-hydroxyisobutyrate dehydrogenase